MTLTRILFTPSELCQWAGMGDYELVSPDGNHTAHIAYEGEPPFGDSYHKAVIDGHAFPGHVWGGMFTFSACSRYLVLGAMFKKWERLTLVIDLQTRRYLALPVHIHEAEVDWPAIVGVGKTSEGKRYTFQGKERWLNY